MIRIYYENQDFLHEKQDYLTGIQKDIFTQINDSTFLYEYATIQQLLFEIRLRAQMVHAAVKLSDSKAAFAPFETSKFNPDYWIRTDRRYVLKASVLPSTAVKDVYINSTEYAFECTTAIVMISYNAVLASINRIHFDYLFSNLVVWDWSYDRDLGITTFNGTDYIPGDIVYFYNPDYKTAIWRGENAVYLGNDKYFGHGIGIKSSKGMIDALNTLRKENATEPAYLLPQFSRLHFQYLAQFAK